MDVVSEPQGMTWGCCVPETGCELVFGGFCKEVAGGVAVPDGGGLFSEDGGGLFSEDGGGVTGGGVIVFDDSLPDSGFPASSTFFWEWFGIYSFISDFRPSLTSGFSAMISFTSTPYDLDIIYKV